MRTISLQPTETEYVGLTRQLGGQPLNLAPADLPLTVEAVAHARAMVTRYEQAVATHPPAGTPLNRRQQAEADNLAHWRRRLDAITRAHQP